MLIVKRAYKGPGEIAPLLKLVKPCKREDLGFNPSTPINKPSWWPTFVILRVGEAEAGRYLGLTDYVAYATW